VLFFFAQVWFVHALGLTGDWGSLDDVLKGSYRAFAAHCMQCKRMVLNSLTFRDFRPVFDQKLEMGCSQRK
jgi:hypothetical protein